MVQWMYLPSQDQLYLVVVVENLVFSTFPRRAAVHAHVDQVICTRAHVDQAICLCSRAAQPCTRRSCDRLMVRMRMIYACGQCVPLQCAPTRATKKKCKVHKSKLPLYTCNLLSEFTIPKKGCKSYPTKNLADWKGAFDLVRIYLTCIGQIAWG